MCRRSGLYISQYYGAGSGPNWLDNLDCTGNEVSLTDCAYTGWGVQYCRGWLWFRGHHVSIVCANSKSLSLSSLPGRRSGTTTAEKLRGTKPNVGLGVGCRRESPSPAVRVRGITPGKFLKLKTQMRNPTFW